MVSWLQENWVVALGLAALLFQAIRTVFWWRWLNRERRAFDARMDAMQRRRDRLGRIREGKP